jgi:hypothetical protein
MGQLALSRGPARMAIRYHGQGDDIPSKGFSFHISNMCPKQHYNRNHVCLSKKRDSFVQVKKKPHIRIQ